MKIALIRSSNLANAFATQLAKAGHSLAVADAGPLKNARCLEPLSGLNIDLGYGAGFGTAISPAWVSAV